MTIIVCGHSKQYALQGQGLIQKEETDQGVLIFKSGGGVNLNFS